MKSQRARDDQAVTIGTALAIFVGVLVVCSLVVAAARQVTQLDLQAAAPWAVGAAALLAGAHLVRRRR